jgi:hypothetical protein
LGPPGVLHGILRFLSEHDVKVKRVGFEPSKPLTHRNHGQQWCRYMGQTASHRSSKIGDICRDLMPPKPRWLELEKAIASFLFSTPRLLIEECKTLQALTNKYRS